MKKVNIVISIMLVACLVTGCGCKKKETEKSKSNDKITNKISNLKIEDSKVFEGLDIINNNTLETILGINKNFVSEYAIGMSKYNYDKLYAVIKPIKGQEDAIKTAMKLYIDAAKEQYKEFKTEEGIDYKKLYDNYLYEEYKEYQIYIVSENNQEVLKEIKKLIK